MHKFRHFSSRVFNICVGVKLDNNRCRKTNVIFACYLLLSKTLTSYAIIGNKVLLVHASRQACMHNTLVLANRCFPTFLFTKFCVEASADILLLPRET